MRCRAISNGSRPSKWWSKIAPFLDYVCLTYHAEHAKWPAFIDTLNVLVGRMQVHVNITMIPERFDQCRESANRIAGLFGSVSVTMKPLLKDFGTQLYDYSAEQLAVLRDGLKGLKRTPSRFACCRIAAQCGSACRMGRPIPLAPASY